MSAFQETKEHIEQKMLLKLMAKIEDDPIVSQRRLATELGIALGLMNTYLKRCMKKGWVRAGQVPAKRLAYFLTPEGLKEKGRMVKDYIASSLTFFRDARIQCESVFAECLKKDWSKIAMVGSGDLAEIARLVGQGLPISLEVINVKEQTHSMEDNLLENTKFSRFDAILITDIQNPQDTYEFIKARLKKEHIEADRLLFLDLLHISQNVEVSL